MKLFLRPLCIMIEENSSCSVSGIGWWFSWGWRKTSNWWKWSSKTFQIMYNFLSFPRKFINFFHQLLEIQAILINIPDPELIIFDSKIQIETLLFGIRYYLHHWFWSSMIVFTNAVALSLFVVCFILINMIPLLPTAKSYLITYIKSKNFAEWKLSFWWFI